MKSPRPARRSPGRQSQRGLALIVVLELLALIVLLVIAFLSSVSVELETAKRYASGVDARSLADSAVNVVIAQVQDATTAPHLAWASQPGMVRTYNDQGEPVTAYKLYSSSPLRVDGAFNAIGNQTTEVPANWAANPSLYTDLNKPVPVAGVNHYPIISPSAVGASTSGGAALDGGAIAPIEGCFLDINNPAALVTATQKNPVPMPVQWMYTLANGALAAMDPVSKTVAGASAANPIVGRVAFWTDDETCKVNINTASEGTFWDRPFTDGAATGVERLMSTSMPASGEFQRYPGHPAMTSLSTVFPRLAGETLLAYNERIYGIIPRVAGGGSKSGSVAVTGTTPAIVADSQRLFASVDELLFTGTTTGGAPRGVNLKGPGLSLTQDDIDRTRFFLTATSRAPEVNLFNKPRITLWPLQANTADVTSPASATNRNATDKLIAFCSTVGGKPYYFQRYNTFNQSLIRGVGANYNPSQNPIPSSQSPVMDWDNIPRNQELYAYLQNLTSTAIPGLGGILGGPGSGTKYNPPTRDQILTEMMDYCRSSVNTFSTKSTPAYTYAPFPLNSTGWVTGEAQVTPLVLNNGGTKTKGFGRFSTVTQASLVFYRSNKLTYVPSPNPTGLPPKDLPDSAKAPPDPSAIVGNITISEYPVAGPATMGAVLLLQTFNPTPGAPPWSGNVRYSVEGLNNLSVNGTPLDFPNPATNLINAQEGYYDATALSGLELMTKYWGGNKVLGIPSVGSSTEEKFFPFFTPPTIPIGGASFSLTGGSIKIKIYQGYSSSLSASDLVQTISMDFPSMTNLPVPNIYYSSSYSAAGNYTTVTSKNSYADYNVRLSAPGIEEAFQHNLKPLIVTDNSFPPYGTRGDVVRSVQARYGGPARGDYRMIAGLADVPSDYFEGHGQKDATTDGTVYTSPAVRVQHSLRMYVSEGNEQTGKSNGFFSGSGLTVLAPSRKHSRLVEGSDVLDNNPAGGWRPNRTPVAPQGMTGAYMDIGAGKSLLGDWDTGPGNQIDGPYVNKADEGNSNIGYYNSGGNTSAGTIVETGASFSPNRQISSAVSFGSLPAGLDPSNPLGVQAWRTLLFCKDPAAGAKHPGFGVPTSGPPYTKPPDHAFLDLFTMPIVEPYAISEPFSTAGKVNMNYQIVPFTYLTRDTAVRAVLKSTRMMAIPTSGYGASYKSGGSSDGGTVTPPPDFRYTINPDEATGTLAGFEKRFTNGDIFRSASEICDIFLVPGARTDGAAVAGSPQYSTMEDWWLGSSVTSTNGYKLTGDNLREQPYGHIYPRLTTKSNTYTVHVQAQTLKKVGTTAANTFFEDKDQVTGEFRGSFLIERYLDPNSDSLVKADGKTPAGELDPDAMVGPYKFRTVSSKRFAP